VSSVSTTEVNVVVGDAAERDEDGSVFSALAVGTGPVRIDMSANEATHRKLCEALKRVVTYDRVKSSEPRPAQLLREVLLGLRPPAARTLDEQPGAFFNEELDGSQKEAITFALATEDVALIHGPPGTGKTTTLVELLLQAVLRHGQRVLVVAPSNVAVDNLLERLVKAVPRAEEAAVAAVAASAGRKCAGQRCRLLRLGHPARTSDAVLAHCLDAQLASSDGAEVVRGVREDLKAITRKFAIKHGAAEHKALRRSEKDLKSELAAREKRALMDLLTSCNVVAATCAGAAARCLDQSECAFDLCIIDEAAMCLEVSCWLPALRCRRLILAGDHCQLPPTIKSDAAAREGLSCTLFERLLQAHGESICRLLSVQYRMHQTISDWCSNAMYEGRLVAAEAVRGHQLQDIEAVRGGSEYLMPLVFIDTAGCEMWEDGDGADQYETSSAGVGDDYDAHASIVGGVAVLSRSNAEEANVVVAHALRLMAAGLPPSDIIIITPYNGQVEAIKTRLLTASMRDLDTGGIEVRSVDGFQGGEREAVIISLVRSNARGHVGFVKDPRRLNVAVTRARRHCAIIGDSDTFTDPRSKAPSVAGLMDYASAHGVLVSALEYMADELPTTATVPSLLSAAAAVPKEQAHFRGKVRSTTEGAGQLGDAPGGLPDNVPRAAAVGSMPFAQVSPNCAGMVVGPGLVPGLGDGLADVGAGSAYLMHRPRGTVVEILVKCRNRTAQVRASLDEPVECLRRRAAIVFGLEAAYELGAPPPSTTLKLIFKATLDDGARLRDTAVRNGSKVILLLAGGVVLPEDRALAANNPVDGSVAVSSEEIMARLEAFAAAPCGPASLSFPATLSAAQRALAHETSEALGLQHSSSGEGAGRVLSVYRAPANVMVAVVEQSPDMVQSVDAAGKSSSVSASSPIGSAGAVGSAPDLRALHLEKVARQQAAAAARAQAAGCGAQPRQAAAGVTMGAYSGGGLKLTDDSDEWTGGAKGGGGKPKKSSKKKGKSDPAGPARAADPPVGGDDMAFLDAVLSQQAAAEKHARRQEPGWKRWVTADGQLSQSGAVGAEAMQHAKLSAKLQTKIVAAAKGRAPKQMGKKK